MIYTNHKIEFDESKCVGCQICYKACFVDENLRNCWKSAHPQKEKVRSQYTFYEYLKEKTE
jgi:Fe-S-cluster-containing dehydrogenase component